MTFGERLRTLRKEKGYKQYELAEKIGISGDMLSKYETNYCEPTLGRIEWICKALGMSATELLGF